MKKKNDRLKRNDQGSTGRNYFLRNCRTSDLPVLCRRRATLHINGKNPFHGRSCFRVPVCSRVVFSYGKIIERGSCHGRKRSIVSYQKRICVSYGYSSCLFYSCGIYRGDSVLGSIGRSVNVETGGLFTAVVS